MNREHTDPRKQLLISMGKSKGYLTYDEINDHMPDDLTSSEGIDDWLSTLGDEGIEVVDSSNSLKGSSEAQSSIKPPDLIEDLEKEEEELEEGALKSSSDPVRMYLRKMGSVSLLTREGEVEIAKRIEEGERRILQVVLNSPIA